MSLKTKNRNKRSNVLAEKLVQFVKETDVSTITEYVELSSTKEVLKLLAEYLDKKLDANISSSEKKAAYSDQNWSLSHADDIGYRRGLREIRKLIGGDHA